MGTRIRQRHPGLFHVTCRSIAEERIFATTADFIAGIQLLGWLVARGLLRCHDFCLMPTHYHLLASFREDALPAAIHHLNRCYAVGFNRRHGRRGHVFDSPYTSIDVVTERHLLVLPAYFAHNPRRLDWPWNAYGGLAGAREQFSFVEPSPVLQAFGSVGRLREFVETWQPTDRDGELIRGGRRRSPRTRSPRLRARGAS